MSNKEKIISAIRKIFTRLEILETLKKTTSIKNQIRTGTGIKRVALLLIFVIMLTNVVSAYTDNGGGVCSCNSCSDCTNALNDNSVCNNEVKLTADIINQSGTCISNPSNFTNKIFDCQGHTIDGDDSGTDYGIYLYEKTGNTIKNCIITDFYYGIYLSSSSNYNTLTSNTANYNNYGI